ncbi:MAG TPA: hypothetical protein PKY77_08495 [Phycisphaerae bacterium]|nr:hypothetical protein [Phycisphaerae bacterium]HRY68732.1 hypothetical protein [Phycisphaerae bacterium]HSA29549.1 hypothetical protein [Phycisphaerae bacterium]
MDWIAGVCLLLPDEPADQVPDGCALAVTFAESTIHVSLNEAELEMTYVARFELDERLHLHVHVILAPHFHIGDAPSLQEGRLLGLPWHHSASGVEKYFCPMTLPKGSR